MTIKQELIAVMERIAAEWNTPSVTVILCCEGAPQSATLYGSISNKGKLTVVTMSAPNETILGIMQYAFDKSGEAYRSQQHQQPQIANQDEKKETDD